MEKNGKKRIKGQDSEQASGAASARTCAREAQVAPEAILAPDVPQNRVDHGPLLIVLGIAWSGD